MTGYIDRYLDVVRPALLKGQASDDLWISRRGRRLSAKTITARVEHWTRQEFDEAFGPHRFKHSAATACVLHSPDEPDLVAAAFRTSPAVLQNHYIQRDAAQVRALIAHASLLDRLRVGK